NSARATRERDRTWSPPEEYVELGRQYLAETDSETRVALFRQMVDIWEEVTPAIILWRNLASWVAQDDLDWTPINSVRMPLGPGHLSVDQG
ncbi:MAG: hypothetical protein AAFX92_03805, partial [Pseudomonadota bacterium]